MADAESGRSQGKATLIAIGGAIGGSLLTIIGQLVVHEVQGRDAEVIEIQRSKTKQMERLIDEYDSLSDVRWRAEAYLDGGQEGSPTEVRRIGSHFDKVVTSVRTNRVRTEDVIMHYGGTLEGWGRRFEDLGLLANERHVNFRAVELARFRMVGEALRALGQGPFERTDILNEALENIGQFTNQVEE